MLKFLRRYQKWMLAVFCAVLMGAFLIQPVISILYPDPGKRTMATIYEGEKIIQNDVRQAQNDLQNLGRLGLALPGLVPTGKDDAEVALGWLLLVKAAEHEGLIASQNEAFTILASTHDDIEDIDDLDKFAADFGATRGYLLELARQYLIAEQYRQLVSGIEYRSEEGISASPGMARLQRLNRPENANPYTRFFQIFADLQQVSGGSNADQANAMDLAQRVMFFDAFGAPRISAPLQLNAVQQRFSDIAGTVAVFDSEDYRPAVTADPQRMQELFDKYKNDPAGAGDPLGFGYRIPNRAQIEAIRVPIEQVRQIAQGQVTSRDVREEFDANIEMYRQWKPRDESAGDEPADETDTPAEGDPAAQPEPAPEVEPGPDPNQGVPPQAEAAAEPAAVEEAAPAAEPEQPAEPEEQFQITWQLREEIRKTLVEIRSRELTVEIARAVREELAKDARGLPEVAGFREVPKDFVPVSLAEAAARVAARFSTDEVKLELEVISPEDQWVSTAMLQNHFADLQTKLEAMEKVSILTADQTGMLNYQDIPAQALTGREGLLFTTTVDAVEVQPRQQRRIGMADYLTTAKSLRGDNSNLPRLGLQKSLPSMVMTDATGSGYVFRITQTQPAHAPATLAEVEDQVRDDAIAAQAYDQLLERKDNLLDQAKAGNLYDIASAGGNVQTLDGFSMLDAPTIEGVANVQPVLVEVIKLIDTLRESGGVSTADSADRTIAIELPREKKLVIFKLNTFDSLSQRRYEAEARKGWVAALAYSEAMPAEAFDPTSILSVEALKQQTGFKWDEDHQPEQEPEAGGSDADE